MATTKKKKSKKAEIIRNLAVISDQHAGSRSGLCPPRVKLDEGGYYTPSVLQKKVYKLWLEYWNDWIPKVTHGEPFVVVNNGDALDNRHHKVTDIIPNLADQEEIAYRLLAPVVDLCEGRYFHIRGTEAHSGPAAEDEERLAKRLGAIPDENGRYSRDELWIQVGDGLCHIMHHIGTAGSTAYESSALMRELAEEYVEAGKHREEPPDVVIRSHRHRCCKIEIPTSDGLGISITTPGWQGKTPNVFRIAGARLATPHFGGILVRQGDEELHTRLFYGTVGRAKREVVTCYE